MIQQSFPSIISSCGLDFLLESTPLIKEPCFALTSRFVSTFYCLRWCYVDGYPMTLDSFNLFFTHLPPLPRPHLPAQHKVLRQDSVLDAIYELDEEAKRRRMPDKNHFVARKLIGEVCLTRYNNKTYKIGMKGVWIDGIKNLYFGKWPRSAAFLSSWKLFTSIFGTVKHNLQMYTTLHVHFFFHQMILTGPLILALCSSLTMANLFHMRTISYAPTTSESPIWTNLC